MIRSEKRQRQLEKMWAACRNPETDEKRRQTMKQRWRDDPSMRRTLAGLQSPGVQKRAGMSRRVPIGERFHAKVEIQPSGCWHWTGARNVQGYGFIADRTGEGRKRRATHISLELDGRPKPDGKPYALHSCDNPQCVNPAHLRWGTAKDNAADMIARGKLNTRGLVGSR